MADEENQAQQPEATQPEAETKSEATPEAPAEKKPAKSKPTAKEAKPAEAPKKEAKPEEEEDQVGHMPPRPCPPPAASAVCAHSPCGSFYLPLPSNSLPRPQRNESLTPTSGPKATDKRCTTMNFIGPFLSDTQWDNKQYTAQSTTPVGKGAARCFVCRAEEALKRKTLLSPRHTALGPAPQETKGHRQP